MHQNPLIVCRVYACIADMLGYMAGEAGIRAGPAANVSWEMAFALLEVMSETRGILVFGIWRNSVQTITLLSVETTHVLVLQPSNA